MSNQVYANGQHKYYSQPGQSIWGIPNDEGFGTPPTPAAKVVWTATPSLDQGAASYLTYSTVDNLFTATEEGLYYLSFIAATEVVAIPPALPPIIWDFLSSIVLDSGNLAASGTTVAKWDGSMPVSATSTASVQIAATVYLPQGGKFAVVMQNKRLDANLVLLQAGTNLFATKLA